MEYTAKFLAQLLKGTVEGDENAKATKFAKIEHGKPGTLSFFANPKYEEYVYTSQASILIVDKAFEPKQPVTPTLVKVENAYSAIADLLKYASGWQKPGVTAACWPGGIFPPALAKKYIWVLTAMWAGTSTLATIPLSTSM